MTKVLSIDVNKETTSREISIWSEDTLNSLIIYIFKFYNNFERSYGVRATITTCLCTSQSFTTRVKILCLPFKTMFLNMYDSENR